MDIASTLADLGLQKTKGSVYIATLETGTGSVIDIAKKARLPRTTVHEILQYLVGLGLVSFVTKGRTRTYTAEPPHKLHILLKEKERKLEHVLPELASLLNSASTKPKVLFYEGVDGIKTVFEDTLTSKDKLLRGILSMQDLYDIPGKEYMDDYVVRRVSADIKLNVIRSEVKDIEETWASSTKEKRDVHYAPKETIFPMTMYLYDNKVSLISTEKENFGMIIGSKNFYDTQKNLFDVLWQVTKVMKRID